MWILIGEKVFGVICWQTDTKLFFPITQPHAISYIGWQRASNHQTAILRRQRSYSKIRVQIEKEDSLDRLAMGSVHCSNSILLGWWISLVRSFNHRSMAQGPRYNVGTLVYQSRPQTCIISKQIKVQNILYPNQKPLNICLIDRSQKPNCGIPPK